MKWDPSTGKVAAKLPLTEGHDLWMSPDGAYLVTLEGRKGAKVVVAKAATLEPVRTVQPQGYVNRVGFGPAGEVLVAGKTLEVL